MILYIFGAGGGAYELLESIDNLHYEDNFYQIYLVEDNPKKEYLEIPYLNKKRFITRQYKILSFDEAKHRFDKSSKYFISACDVKYKQKIAEMYPDFDYLTFTHASADILPDNKGKGNWFCQNTHIGSNVVIGNHVRVNYSAALGHSCAIGDYSFIGINSAICAGTKIGKGVYVGSGSTIINKNIVIGDYSTIGAGAVVTKDVKPKSTVMGVPAKEIEMVKAGAKK